MYCAIIGDLINSKEIKNRKELQENLKLLLKNINNKYNCIETDFTITLGDEFQALLIIQYDILKLYLKLNIVCILLVHVLVLDLEI